MSPGWITRSAPDQPLASTSASSDTPAALAIALNESPATTAYVSAGRASVGPGDSASGEDDGDAASSSSPEPHPASNTTTGVTAMTTRLGPHPASMGDVLPPVAGPTPVSQDRSVDDRRHGLDQRADIARLPSLKPS